MKFWTKAAFLVCMLGGVSVARAEVIDAADNGFTLKISVSVPATPEQAFKQFIRVGQWWSAAHTWWGKAENLSIQPWAGGCFCEKEGDKTARHLEVAFVDPGREIRLLGGLGPLQGMGLHGALTVKFIPVSDNETSVVQIYRVSGYAKDGLKGLAPIVDQVQTLQMNNLRASFKGGL